MRRGILILAAALAAAAAVFWLAVRKPPVPEVPFAKTRQETLVSILTTNEIGRAHV
mgnify:CR=1 FL=1